jgi:hypothetical protein
VCGARRIPDSGMGSEKVVVECLSGEGGRLDRDVVEAIWAVTRELMDVAASLVIVVVAPIEIGRGKRFVGDAEAVPVLWEATIALTEGPVLIGLVGDFSLET